MTDMFKDLLKVADNEWSSIVEDGIEGGDVKYYVDTGSYTLNALLSGSIYDGLAGNKRLILAGAPSTGKTFYAISIVDNFLKQHKEARNFYFESETATSKKQFESRGVDTSRIANMPVGTIQEFRTQAIRIIDKYIESKMTPEEMPVMFVLDSLGNLSTSKEVEDIAAGKDTRDMTRAQLIRGAFRILTLKLGRAGIPLIMTNHIYDNVGGYGPLKKMGGGGGAEYAGDQILFLTKAKDSEGDGEDKITTGAIITATLYKSRLTIENKQVKTLLDYKTGLDRYYGLVPLAIKLGVFKKVSTRVELPNGKTQFQKTIQDNPEEYFTKEVLDLIDAACKEEFLYGTTNVTDVKENEI